MDREFVIKDTVIVTRYETEDEFWEAVKFFLSQPSPLNEYGANKELERLLFSNHRISSRLFLHVREDSLLEKVYIVINEQGWPGCPFSLFADLMSMVIKPGQTTVLHWRSKEEDIGYVVSEGNVRKAVFNMNVPIKNMNHDELADLLELITQNIRNKHERS